MKKPIQCPHCGKIHGYALIPINAEVGQCDCMNPIEKRFRAIEYELSRIARQRENKE